MDETMGPAWMGVRRRNALKSIRLAFVRAHVAARAVSSPGTRLAALIGPQKVPYEVTTAG